MFSAERRNVGYKKSVLTETKIVSIRVTSLRNRSICFTQSETLLRSGVAQRSEGREELTEKNFIPSLCKL